MGPPDVILEARPGARIQSVSRAARLLLAVAQSPDGRTAKEMASAIGLSLPTTYHLLSTLVAEGFLVKSTSRRYHFGPTIGVISDGFLSQYRPPEYLQRALVQLAEQTGETAYLSGWRGEDIVVLSSVEGTQAVRVSGLHSGFQGDAHARASGKLLLAFAPPGAAERYLRRHPLRPLTPHTIIQEDALRSELQLIRERGYSMDDQEFRLGVTCVAAPVLAGGAAIASLCISAPSDRFHRERAALTRTVIAAAAAVRPTADGAAVAGIAS